MFQLGYLPFRTFTGFRNKKTVCFQWVGVLNGPVENDTGLGKPNPVLFLLEVRLVPIEGLFIGEDGTLTESERAGGGGGARGAFASKPGPGELWSAV